MYVVAPSRSSPWSSRHTFHHLHMHPNEAIVVIPRLVIGFRENYKEDGQPNEHSGNARQTIRSDTTSAIVSGVIVAASRCRPPPSPTRAPPCRRQS